MAEIRVDNTQLKQILSDLPNINNKLKNGLTKIASNLEVIRKNMDSEGINTILTKYCTSINSLKDDMASDLSTAQEYLKNKLAGYQTVANRTDDQLNKVNTLLAEMGLK